jgi:hypothetical protein
LSDTSPTTNTDTAANQATAKSIDAYISGGADKAAPLFDQAAAQHRRAEGMPADPDGWRDGTEAIPLSPMPPAPSIEATESDTAMATLREHGGESAALVDSWGSDFSSNLAYAKSAFAEIATPELIAKFNASGLGDSPLILEHLARFGRLNAGMMGDRTIERNNNNVTQSTSTPQGNKPSSTGSSAQDELNDLLDANPPGTQAYNNPQIQRRVEALSRAIAGSGNIVGQGRFV